MGVSLEAINNDRRSHDGAYLHTDQGVQPSMGGIGGFLEVNVRGLKKKNNNIMNGDNVRVSFCFL